MNSSHQGPRPPRKQRGFAISKGKRVQKVPSPSTSSSSIAREIQHRRACSRSRNLAHDDVLDELALPLGMSFAAVLSQVLDDKLVSGCPLGAEHLTTVCSSVVKESVSNIYGKRFDFFIRNFEKSFGSTLKALQVIKALNPEVEEDRGLHDEGDESIYEPLGDDQQAGCSLGSPASSSCEVNDNQLVLCGKSSRQLACANLTTLERSVLEQTRSNDLKAVEIGLMMRRLQMKQSQLAVNSYSNLLEKMKIRLNVSKAVFKEEKLRNQMEDTRQAELLRRCIDLLVSGLCIMCSSLVYGASIFSYQRITEAISPCVVMPTKSKPWWMPKSMASLDSGWQMLRCQAVAVTRMAFGLLMILVIAYSLLQRSAVVGPTMPVTFVLLLLGVACGAAGKMCVDTLGGSGYVWLVYWEALCLVHLLANLFPSVLSSWLYGRVLAASWEKAIGLPYWIRRNMFYGVLLLIIPAAAGLLPFASVAVWKEHFAEKMTPLFG